MFIVLLLICVDEYVLMPHEYYRGVTAFHYFLKKLQKLETQVPFTSSLTLFYVYTDNRVSFKNAFINTSYL